MNTLEEAPRPILKTAPPKDALKSLRPSPVGYVVGAVAALAIHAGILFGWSKAHTYEQIEFGMEIGEESVEVDLVAALPAEEVIEATEVSPEPKPEPEPQPEVPPPPPPDPMPEPPPEPEKPPEMTLPDPPPVQEPPPPAPVKPKPKPPKTERKPARVATVSGDGSAPVPGTAGTTQRRSAGGKSSKPGYLRNPHPAYPEESRRHRQHGVVQLRVEVNEQGDPTSVTLSRSSGYPLLDERALTTVRSRWKFRAPRVDGVPVSTSVVIPIRFTLD